MAIRTNVIYRGRVQGVGFRATACQLAAGLDVRGFVRNLPDGSVELEAQGPADQVQRLLDSIAAQFKGSIREAAAQPCAPHESDEAEFRITH